MSLPPVYSFSTEGFGTLPPELRGVVASYAEDKELPTVLGSPSFRSVGNDNFYRVLVHERDPQLVWLKEEWGMPSWQAFYTRLRQQQLSGKQVIPIKRSTATPRRLPLPTRDCSTLLHTAIIEELVQLWRQVQPLGHSISPIGEVYPESMRVQITNELKPSERADNWDMEYLTFAHKLQRLKKADLCRLIQRLRLENNL